MEHLCMACTCTACCLQDDAEAADWFDINKLPKLAFDHKLIVRTAFQHMLDRHAARGKCMGQPVSSCTYYRKLTYMLHCPSHVHLGRRVCRAQPGEGSPGGAAARIKGIGRTLGSAQGVRYLLLQ